MTEDTAMIYVGFVVKFTYWEFKLLENTLFLGVPRTERAKRNIKPLS